MQEFEEVTIPVGKTGSRQSKRFVGRVLTRWVHRTGSEHVEVFTVYRTAKGQYAVHLERSQGWREWADPTMWTGPNGWTGMVTDLCRTFSREMSPARGSRIPRWGLAPGCIESRLDAYQTIEELEENAPRELADLVRDAESEPQVEEVDI